MTGTGMMLLLLDRREQGRRIGEGDGTGEVPYADVIRPHPLYPPWLR